MIDRPAHHSPAASSARLAGLLLIPLLPLSLLIGSLAVMPLPWRLAWPWAPALDLSLVLYVDGLSAQFLLLITGIGSLVFCYAAGYLAGHPRQGRIYLLLTLFMAAMIGAVVSDHLLVLFIFWELTSVLSYLLVGTDHEQESSRKSAQQALLVTGGGGVCLLAGIILLGRLAGTYEIQALLARAPHYLDAPELIAALALIFLGAFCKSAQFPFHFWLPNAMAAPTPVSAYLHSATMVKLGIYLLARFDAAFTSLPFWEYTLVGIGTLTAVLAAGHTVQERDLKRLLAWSTVATLGTLTMLVGLPGHGAALATVALFFAHALYKAPLFFVAGNLDHGAGTRKIDRLTGMRHFMPWTAAAALLAALSMAGLPLTFGFVAKDAIALAKEQAGTLHLVSYATVFVNGVSLAVATIAAIHVFWGRRPALSHQQPHEVPAVMWLPPLLLAALGLLFGFAPTLVAPLLGAAAMAVAPGFDPGAVVRAYDLLHVIEAMIGALVIGLAILLFWERLGLLYARSRPLHKFGPEDCYRLALKLLPRVAARLTRTLQHGRLPDYLLVLVGAVTVIGGWLLWLALPAQGWPAASGLSVPVAGAALLIAAGAVAAVLVRDHLLLLLVSGLVGYGSAVLFLFTGAPDLAFTQFAVETVFVVVAATMLRRMRHLANLRASIPGEQRLRPLALAVAVGFGALMTSLVLLVSALPLDPALSDFYAAQSLPAGHGRNVVNLILVDFRALDTLGEISVLLFALVAALPLLGLARKPVP